jgi:hypothetical protein
MTEFATAGSQRWLQVAIDREPKVLLEAVRRSHAIPPSATIAWSSPIREGKFQEYRDLAALSSARIANLRHPLKEFWPARGPVWDAIGVTSDGHPVFVEAKAHIAEAASPPSRASEASLRIIQRSLAEARKWYAPKAKADWSGLFYQYGNRLAHHYFLRKVNGLPSILVFLYFTNAVDMQGPESEAEWKGASRLIHASLGLPAKLESRGVFDAFVDVRKLRDA